MTNLREYLLRFSRSESGATLVEYGIALFVAVSVGGLLLTQLAGSTSDNFSAADAAADDICDVASPPEGCTVADGGGGG